MKIGVLVGSLRKESYARKIALNAINMFPEDFEGQIIEIGNLPLYNADLEANPPQEYIDFRNTIQSCDAILFVTSENNRTIPACLKNAVDVGSKPTPSWTGLPAGIMSHSVGRMGGYSAHKNLRLALSYFEMPITGQPEVFLGQSPTLFDGDKLVPDTAAFVQRYIDTFEKLVRKNVQS